MGRKATPTTLRIIRKNPSKRALPKKEPRAEVIKPSQRVPDSLKGNPIAKKEWRRLCKMLSAMNLVTSLDLVALEMFCQAYATWRDAHEKVAQSGYVIKSPSGYPVQNPYLAVANKAQEQLVKLGTEFGFTPSSRTGVEAIENPGKGGGRYTGM